jgi:C_GCAxxG_C_C family probable redox protein
VEVICQLKGEIEMATQPSKEILDKLDEKIEKYFGLSANCAQTSFVALQEQFDLDDGVVLKALTAFPGIALRGETCGAVIGSMMALGTVFGREKLDDRQGYFAALSSAGKFCDRFVEELGSTMCGDILEAQFGKRYDLKDPAQIGEWQAAGAAEKCRAVVTKAVRIAAEIMQDKTPELPIANP